MKKTAGPANPDPSIFKFYCPHNQCWCMSDDICTKSVSRILRAQAAHRAQRGRPDVSLEGLPHVINCMECERGGKIMDELTGRPISPKPKPPVQAAQPAPKKRGRKPLGKGPCNMPGCRNKAQQHGLCRNHYSQALRNCLIKPNTQTNIYELKNLIPALAEMAKKSGKPVGEVAYRAMVEGVRQYFDMEATK